MTAGGFREVDHDLLADYLGGALDGTPDGELVARLVDEDADWAQAYALLAPAVADVRADLAAWGAPTPEMPADVADRIVAALAHAAASGPGTVDSAAPDRSEPGGRGTEDEAASAEERPEGQPAVRTGLAVPTQPLGGSGRRPAGVPRSEPGRGGATGPGRRRRRWTRLAGPVALAAVSIAAVGLGVSQLTGDQQLGGAADTALPGAANREDVGPAAATPFRIAGEPSVRSGTDYTPESLAVLPSSPKSPLFTGGPPGEQPGVQAEGGRLPGSATGLDRLTDPAALGACIGEIKAEHGNGPLVVDVVDYARFQGRPALIVRFTDATGARWAWASGPECGVPGSGSDSRYRTRVG
ncbi:hypothetical protein ACSNN9_22205 [Micromonospora sp. URMC 107]|uniref:hypothetical protein n=1 Tax=Micromonospora sp. URMC 107 TaxID=3423418 RepID=UPI003F1A2228